MTHWVEAVDVMSHTSHTHKTYTQQCSKCTQRFLDAVNVGHVGLLMHSSCTLRFFFSIVAVSDTFFSAIFRSVPKHSKVNG